MGLSFLGQLHGTRPGTDIKELIEFELTKEIVAHILTKMDNISESFKINMRIIPYIALHIVFSNYSSVRAKNKC